MIYIQYSYMIVSPLKPSFLATSIIELPFCWFSFETMVSAGCETIAQNTPAAMNNKSSIVTR